MELTSKERLLRAISRQDVDYIPCCPMSFAAMRQRHADDRYAAALAEQEMGLDPMLFIPSAARKIRKDHPDLRGLPVRFHPDVSVREWVEEDAQDFDILHKEYQTPAGTLTTSVRLSDDWPHGDHIPFIDDYQIPRAFKPLITGFDDLDALKFMLMPPQPEDIAAFKQEAQQGRDFAQKHGMLLAGGWGVGMDMANWLCGMQNLMAMMMQQADFVGELLGMIHQWNTERMKVVLAEGVDLYMRRAWYEGCDFVIPRFYKQYILPLLKAEADLVHAYGGKFGYICSSGTKPMLDFYPEAGFDVLLGLDPVQGTFTDMPLMKEKLGDAICLWGGVSAAVTVEQGTEEEVRAAVRHAVDVLGPKGFILSPIDNITEDTPHTWRNLEVFIEEWKAVR